MYALARGIARRGREITQTLAGCMLIVGGVLVVLGPYVAAMKPFDQVWVAFILGPLLVPLGLAILAGMSVRRAALRSALTASALGLIAIAIGSLMFAIFVSVDGASAPADLAARIAPVVISFALVVLAATLRPRTGRKALSALMLTAAVFGIAAAVTTSTPTVLAYGLVLDLFVIVLGLAALPHPRWQGRWLVGALWPLDDPLSSQPDRAPGAVA